MVLGVWRRLRGWGGVAGMAAACALTAAALLSAAPLVRGDQPTGALVRADQPTRLGPYGPGVGQARPASTAGECTDPEASLRPSSADGPAVERIKQRGRLIAGVDQNSFRWGYRDPATGQLAGFDIDLARAIAKDILGSADQITFRAIPTNQRIPALKNRTVDVVVRTMTINCERLKDVAFSTAYFIAGQQVLVPRGSPITAFDSTLAGKKVCTAKGSTGEAELRKESHGARVMTVPNQLDCLVRLQLGQVDAVVTDNALAAGQAAQDPSVKLVGKPFTTEPYGVALNKTDRDLIRRVNKVLADYRSGGADSPWMRAYRKWLADDLKGIDGPPAPRYAD